MLGFDFETWRVGTGYEDHDTIDYSKWFLEGDKRLTTGRFDFYAGVEVGWIWRKHFYELQNFKGVVVDDLKASMTAGMNFEMQFKIIEGVHFTSNINVFTTEGNSTRWQFLRWDWMSGVVIKIPYTL